MKLTLEQRDRHYNEAESKIIHLSKKIEDMNMRF